MHVSSKNGAVDVNSMELGIYHTKIFVGGFSVSTSSTSAEWVGNSSDGGYRYIDKVELVVVKRKFVICIVDLSVRFPMNLSIWTVLESGLKQVGTRSLIMIHLGTRSQ